VSQRIGARLYRLSAPPPLSRGHGGRLGPIWVAQTIQKSNETRLLLIPEGFFHDS
jgi:hypothetical protein